MSKTRAGHYRCLSSTGEIHAVNVIFLNKINMDIQFFITTNKCTIIIIKVYNNII